MLYAYDITIPADTPESNPIVHTLKLNPGVLTKVSVKFPAGCHGLVKIRILKFETNLVPLNRDGWITGDNEAIVADEYFELDERPYELKLIGCSPGTSYPHTISVRLVILPRIVASMLALIEKVEEIISYVFG